MPKSSPGLLQKEIVRIGKLLYQKNFIAAAEGNISVRLDRDKILVTPSGLNKGSLKPREIIAVDANGKKLSGRHQPSSELKMHLAVYKRRKDIHAIVHAHPPYATALTVTGQSLERFFLPEAVLSLDRVPLSSYATPTTAEVPAAVSRLIRRTDAVLLRNHGVLACGKNLTDAYHKLETVEKLAQIYFLAKGMGRINYLSRSQIKNLKKIKTSLSV
ncbi:MAG: class II aldolase/adducin family protein [candidate division Zixibacteria bacterium]|nr:class II aldolase/adducin family protein [candidate division Zixibacteria bacterium]